ncbi:MAG TPA: nicotinate-nucleotide adenylyltransferase [Solirubrobacterales bacterium]|nr:nicotinate-nucleotide adenylyltransferase [Solirubrobacterales bacterium]
MRTQGSTRRDPRSRAAEPEPASQPRRRARARRVGILGGTFDPPHIGHLWLATLAADELGLGHVLLMPAARPPHKGDRAISNAADRVMMTRLAIGADPMLDLSLVEMERPGPSYTVDSLAQLRSHLGDEVGLVLIMAADSFAEIEDWREPDRLLELAEWAIGPRPGSPMPEREALRARYGARATRIHLLEGPSLDLSSSEIRERVAAGRPIRYLVPRAVEELIVSRGLYRRRRP